MPASFCPASPSSHPGALPGDAGANGTLSRRPACSEERFALPPETGRSNWSIHHESRTASLILPAMMAHIALQAVVDTVWLDQEAAHISPASEPTAPLSSTPELFGWESQSHLDFFDTLPSRNRGDPPVSPSHQGGTRNEAAASQVWGGSKEGGARRL